MLPDVLWFSALFLLLTLRPLLSIAESEIGTLPGSSTCTVLSEEWLLCASHPQTLRLIISQVCLGEEDPIPQTTWGSNQRTPAGTWLGLLHPIGIFDLACRSEAFARLPDLHCPPVRWQVLYTSCDGHSGTERYAFWLDTLWLQRKAPKTIFQPPVRLFILAFLGMHFVNHSGDGKFMYLYGKFIVVLLVSRKSNWVCRF